MTVLSRLMPSILILSLLCPGLSLAVERPQAASFSAPRVACEAFSAMDLSGLADGEAPARVLAATIEPAGTLNEVDGKRVYAESRTSSAPLPGTGQAVPSHCLLRGYINPHIQFELRFPEKDQWNGKFLFVACNGFCGRVEKANTLTGLLRNYATMTTDGGHVSAAGFDSVWARNNMQARIDFGHRANHVSALAAKAMIALYYGAGPKHSYITGCSKGGQAGVMSAQRYPAEFDGVIDRGPTIDYTGVNILPRAKMTRAVYNADGSLNIDVSKHRLIMNAVMAYCDPKDGLLDGLISNPLACDFDPQMIACGNTVAGEPCLTPTEVQALRTLYGPVRNKAGDTLYPGAPLGSESAWDKWVLPKDSGHKVMAYRAASGYLRDVAFAVAPDSRFDWYGFDAEANTDRLAEVSAHMDVKDPDFTAFRDSGGKMIVTHGWSDEAIPATASIWWYDKVSAVYGGRDRLAGFVRLFLLPGVQHCGSDGPGPSGVDALTALENWVEKGQAPDHLVTQKEAEGGAITRTRPVYAYPVEAQYRGRGSIDDAASFKPVDPRR